MSLPVHNHDLDPGCAEHLLGSCMIGELQASEHEVGRRAAERQAAIYKDAFKDAAMANTAASRRLAEQEAKTVEYRAAWIKATRERDDARRRLREAVATDA